MAKNPYEGAVAIVTGASAGIGTELALQLADRGAKVVLAARDAERLEAVAEQCRGQGAEALVVPTDVGDRGACKALIEKTVAEFGRIDVLFNNAGYAVGSELAELEDIELFDRQMRVNFNGSMWCTYFALPHLIKSGGRICAISSVAGWFSMAGNSIYNASKFAMRGFFDSIRQELKPKGVSVTVIYPGYVVTEFFARVENKSGVRRGPEALGFYKKSMMTAATCARITLDATARRKRDVLMTIQAKIGLWVKRLFPGLIDKILIAYRRRRDQKLEQLKTE